jgi:hypothetical protein
VLTGVMPGCGRQRMSNPNKPDPIFCLLLQVKEPTRCLLE